MTVNLCEIRTHWINVLKDTEKGISNDELLDKIKIVNHKRFDAVTEDTEFGWTKEKSPEWFVTHVWVVTS